MTALAGLQQQFIDYLHDRPNAFLHELADTGGLDAPARAHVYFNAYRIRLVDTLKDSFDKTWAWLGDEAFEQAAQAYIAAHPPSHFSLREFGDRFSAWLRTRYPTDAEVAELASLDWALRAAFDGPDAQALTADALAALTPEQWDVVVLHPHPTLTLLDMRHNTPELWHAMDRGDSPPAVTTQAATYPLRVWRRELQPHFRSIGAEEATMLSAMQRGVQFALACEAIESGDDGEAQQRVALMLSNWLEDGVLAGLSFGEPA